MYKKQFEDDVWACYNFELIFISIWNILKMKKNDLKTRGIKQHIGEGGVVGWHLSYSVSFVDAVFKTT